MTTKSAERQKISLVSVVEGNSTGGAELLLDMLLTVCSHQQLYITAFRLYYMNNASSDLTDPPTVLADGGHSGTLPSSISKMPAASTDQMKRDEGKELRQAGDIATEADRLSSPASNVPKTSDPAKAQHQDALFEGLSRQIHVLSIERDMLQIRLNAANASNELLLVAAHDDIASLRDSTVTRFSEIAAVTGRLLEARQQIAQLQTANDTLAGRVAELEARWPNHVWERLAALSTKVRNTFRIGFKRTLGRAYIAARRRRDAKALAAIRHSVLFSEGWYGRHYRDVRRTKLSPAEDYFYFGAAEGRSPGPDFDSSAYYDAYPFVARSGLNALVHYETVGREKGRRIWPVKKKRP